MQACDTDNVTEASIHQACEGADYRHAAELTIRRYGDEVFRFLASRMRNESDASEVFSIFAEALWQALPGFGWRCAVRTFCYTIARNAANRYGNSPAHRRERNVALSEAQEILQVADSLRTQTQAYLRSEVKNRFRLLREQLDADDQMLLILRVDRNMPWRDLAVAMTDGGETLPEAELTREAAKLRKRFQVLKTRLKQLAQAEGLLSDPTHGQNGPTDS